MQYPIKIEVYSSVELEETFSADYIVIHTPDAANALRNALNEWISVEERLPDAGQKVTVSVLNAYGKRITTIAQYIPEFWKEDEGDYEDDSQYSEEQDKYFWPKGWYESQYEPDVNYLISDPVTHFMPLPSPPQTTQP